MMKMTHYFFLAALSSLFCFGLLFPLTTATGFLLLLMFLTQDASIDVCTHEDHV